MRTHPDLLSVVTYQSNNLLNQPTDREKAIQAIREFVLLGFGGAQRGAKAYAAIRYLGHDAENLVLTGADNLVHFAWEVLAKEAERDKGTSLRSDTGNSNIGGR